MSSIINVLTDSFELLQQKPWFFVPKLVSSVLGALWAIGLFSRTGPLYLYAVTGLPLAALALFVSVMLAAMVEGKDSGSVIRKGFIQALKRWRKIMVAFLGFILVALLLYLPLGTGFAAYYFSGQPIYPVAGGVFSLALLFGFSFLSYFFPVSLLEKETVLEGFRESASTSWNNSRQVLPLTVLSFVLLGIAAVTPDAGMKMLGYGGFFTMRIISGVLTTYIFVVSPEYYLRSRP